MDRPLKRVEEICEMLAIQELFDADKRTIAIYQTLQNIKIADEWTRESLQKLSTPIGKIVKLDRHLTRPNFYERMVSLGRKLKLIVP